IQYKFQYAVKIICTSHIPGTSQTSDGLLPGTYETAVNIHNPHEKGIKIRKKLANPGAITKYKSSEIEPDGVERFVCRNIQDFGITFIHGFEGFLVIDSGASLDVTAVYTAGSSGGSVSSIAVEQIRERRL
ncbi:MAG: hypothetical protein WBS20_03625, partial [Lysobacterales bacterium]